MLKKLLLVVVLVAGMLVAPHQAEPAGDCTLLDQDLAKLAVPAEVKKMAEDTRSLNPYLDHLSLPELATTRGAELNLLRAGFINESQLDNLIKVCIDYNRDVVDKMSFFECGEQVLNGDLTKEGEESQLKSYPALENTVGYMQLCLLK